MKKGKAGVCLLVLMVLLSLASSLAAQTVQQGTERLPFGNSVIDYEGPAESNVVAELALKVARGDAKLEFDDRHGYLKSLLAALEITPDSQILVFSKSSLNKRLITPQHPRAVYFNDSVYIGWVEDAPALEISAVDREKGTLFYTLEQRDLGQQPKFVREQRCTICHASTTALGVPGQLVRSYETDHEGNLLAGYSQITHTAPLAHRWGGWYVTGQADALEHMGNLIDEGEHRRHRREPDFRGVVQSLDEFFPTQRFLRPTSDIVALLMLDHQCHWQNLATRAGFEHRYEMKSDIVEQLVAYTLMAGEAEWEAPIAGDTPFAKWYEAQGPLDPAGRSLRQLELDTRLFRFRCSPQVYSEQLLALPQPVKQRFYELLQGALLGQNKLGQHLPEAERRAVQEILAATHPELKALWREASFPAKQGQP